MPTSLAVSRSNLSRKQPSGVQAGSPGTLIQGPGSALSMVASELAACEAALREIVVSDVAAIPTVAGHLVKAGGKRLRPALTALGAKAVGFNPDPDRLARLMCVGEMIHLGSLLHDDVVDGADQRRGQDAAHKVYGAPVSILSGDFCLARAVLLASEEGGHDAVTGLARAVTEMAEGEVLQLQHAHDLSLPAPDYFTVIERKSAALIAWCASAAALAKGDKTAAEALATYGRKVGTAFQITDDVLDYAQGTGKRAGADLMERKATLPLLFALEADPELKGFLLAGPVQGDRLQQAMDRVQQAKGLERSMDYAGKLVDDAIVALDVLDDNLGKQALIGLGRYLVERAV